MRLSARRAILLCCGSILMLALWAGGALAGAGAAGAASPAGATGSAATPPPAPAAAPFDLAVGGSGSVGFQPTATHPHGQATDTGYADDLAARMVSRWPGLTLVRIGCPGMTTETMISGGGHCVYREGSQLETALSFLHTHPSTDLVTVDLGFNDLIPCLRAMEVDSACVTTALSNVAAQMPQILAALRQAAPDATRFVGVGHYDPFLADDLRGPAGHTFADATLGVIERLNDVLRAAYTHAGIPMADVASAFELRDTTPIDVLGLGTVPTDVARVCSLTWMCATPPMGHNTHPNDDGYRVEAAALAAALS